jgi:hypothetical protein
LPEDTPGVTLRAITMTRPLRLSVLVAALLLAAPPVAGADHPGHDDREVRVAGTCGGSVRSKLKLKEDDGRIEAELEVRDARRGSSWRVVIAQEGRVVIRTTARASRATGSFSLERRLRDLSGADRISVRASGPRGITCRAAATLPGS